MVTWIVVQHLTIHHAISLKPVTLMMLLLFRAFYLFLDVL